MEMGPVEQNLIRQMIRAGEPLPARIQEAPELEQGLYLYLQAFFDLDSERSHAFGPVAIPWGSIKAYAEAFEFDEEQTEDLFYFIRKMDSVHLDRIREKMPKPSTTRKAKK